VLRHLSAEESPMPGALLGGQRLRVRTDAALWEDNPAWRAEPTGHVLAPLDAGRDADGCAVFVPHCPTRLRQLLERRVQLNAGEAVTVAVSVLRGAAEASALGADVGTWWITDDGRPVVAIGGHRRWDEEGDDILSIVKERCPDVSADAFARAARALSDPRRLTRDLESLESAFFDAAAPAPLSTELVSVRARSASAARPIRVTTEQEVVPSGGFVHDFVTRHVDARWADQVAQCVRRVGRLVPSQRAKAATTSPREQTSRRRRLPLLIACGAGAAVLVAGLSWPEEPHEKVAAAAEASQEVATGGRPERTPLASQSPDPETPVDSGEGAPSAAAALIDRFALCNDDGCGTDVVEDPARRFPDGPATDRSAERTVRVIDEYGGVTALRVVSEGREQIVVIVRHHEKWLVRDIYDVADQP
jgi:hypothetical protein